MEEKNITCIFLVVLVLSIPALILSLIFLYASGNEDTIIGFQVENYILYNLEQDPLFEIYYGNVCPKGFRTTIISTWPGTKTGCLGENGVAEKCSYSKQTIKATSKKNFINWGPDHFCDRKLKRYIHTVQRPCPIDFIPCQKDLCVYFEDKCPITDIEVISSDEVMEGDEVVDYIGNSKLLITRNKNAQPIVEIKVSLSNKPCLAMNRISYHDVYPLLNIGAGCGKYGLNIDSHIIDYKPEIEFYKENNFTTILSALPEFESYAKDQKSLLTYTPRIEIKPTSSCVKQIAKMDIISDPYQIKDHTRWLKVFIVIKILTIIGSLLVAGLYIKDPHSKHSGLFMAIYLLALIAVAVFVLKFLFLKEDIQSIQEIHDIITSNETISTSCIPSGPIREAIIEVDSSIGTFNTYTYSIVGIEVLSYFISLMILTDCNLAQLCLICCEVCASA